MDFTEVHVGSSDEESVSSQGTYLGDADNWIRSERRYNDHFQVHEFHLESGWEPIYNNRPELFARDVAHICSGYDHASITAIRLRATIIDETTGEIREKIRIRLEYTLFNYVDDLKDMILELIVTNIAPMWIRIEDFETSDTALGKFVWYDLKFFDLCVQKTPRTPFHTTMIVGDGQVHPGVWVKRIFSKDHNIEYGPKDCVIMCLNEATGKRLSPAYVKKCIWPNADYPETLDFHHKKHLRSLSIIYDTKIMLYSVDDCQMFVIGKQRNYVKLVKVGKVVGVLDRFEQISKLDEDDAGHLEGYFDLETVGEKQQIYAYSIKTPYCSSTIVHADVEEVEYCLMNDISNMLKEIPNNESIIMYSWNGSRFDSYIMLRILAKQDRFKVDRLIINSANELLTFRVRLGDNSGSILFRDPCKLFPNTLEGAAGILGLEICKSTNVDHDEIERNFISNEWSRYLNDQRNVIYTYVQQDVYLLINVVNGIRSLYSHKNEYALPLRVCLTRSMASSILWMKMLPKDVRDMVRELHIDPYTEINFRGMRYMDIMHHAVGGRVQCVRRGIFKQVGAIDVKSMYPYVCANCEFPCGDTTFVREYVPGKLGVYYVRILKQTKPMVIPYRVNRRDAYNWEYTKSFEKWVTSVDLEQIDEYQVLYGIVWSIRTGLFFKTYMELLYQERVNAKSKALNLHWKIVMNALTGSLFQAALRDFTIILTHDNFQKTMKKYSDIVHVLSVDDLNSNEIIVIFRPIKLAQGSPKIAMQKEFCASAITSKPWILTMFIYAYARRKLRDKWIEIESNNCSKVLYCDTDSLVFSHCNLITIESGNNLGDWQKEHWNVNACIHASKVYAVDNKVRIKGISPNSQSTICDTEIDMPTLNSFEEASLFFRDGKPTAVKPGYEHVKALVQGKHVYFMNWYMEKSRTEGIIKRYCIKHMKPDVKH